MADFDFPPDLVELQREFFAADARCSKIADTLPSSLAIYGGAEVDFAELEMARAERLGLLDRLQAHSWFDSLEPGQRNAARNALRTAARATAGKPLFEGQDPRGLPSGELGDHVEGNVSPEL